MIGYIYICRREHSASGLLKIGHTDNLDRRMADFDRETGADSGIILEFAFSCPADVREQVERRAHHLAREHRRRGEWFELSLAEAVDFVSNAAEDLNIELATHFDRIGAEDAAIYNRAFSAIKALEAHEVSKPIPDAQIMAGHEKLYAESLYRLRSYGEQQCRETFTKEAGEGYAAMPYIGAVIGGVVSLDAGHAGAIILVAGVGYCLGWFVKEHYADKGADRFNAAPNKATLIDAKVAAEMAKLKAEHDARVGECQIRANIIWGQTRDTLRASADAAMAAAQALTKSRAIDCTAGHGMFVGADGTIWHID